MSTIQTSFEPLPLDPATFNTMFGTTGEALPHPPGATAEQRAEFPSHGKNGEREAALDPLPCPPYTPASTHYAGDQERFRATTRSQTGWDRVLARAARAVVAYEHDERRPSHTEDRK